MADEIKLAETILNSYVNGTISELSETCDSNEKACGGKAIVDDQELVIDYVLFDGKVTEREKQMLGFLPAAAVSSIAGADGMNPARMKAAALVKKLAAAKPEEISEIVKELSKLNRDATRQNVEPAVNQALERMKKEAPGAQAAYVKQRVAYQKRYDQLEKQINALDKRIEVAEEKYSELKRTGYNRINNMNLSEDGVVYQNMLAAHERKMAAYYAANVQPLRDQYAKLEKERDALVEPYDPEKSYNSATESLQEYAGGTKAQQPDLSSLIQIYLKDGNVEDVLVSRLKTILPTILYEQVVQVMKLMKVESLKSLIDSGGSDLVSKEALRIIVEERKVSTPVLEGILVSATQNKKTAKSQAYAIADLAVGPFKGSAAENFRRKILMGEIRMPEGIIKGDVVKASSSVLLKDLIAKKGKDSEFWATVLLQKAGDKEIGPMAVAAIARIYKGEPKEMRRVLSNAFHKSAAKATIDAATTVLRKIKTPEEGICSFKALADNFPASCIKKERSAADLNVDNGSAPAESEKKFFTEDGTLHSLISMGGSFHDIAEVKGEETKRNKGYGLTLNFYQTAAPYHLFDKALSLGLGGGFLFSRAASDYEPRKNTTDSGETDVVGIHLVGLAGINFSKAVFLDITPRIGYYHVSHEYGYTDDGGVEKRGRSMSEGKFGFGSDFSLKFMMNKENSMGLGITASTMKLGIIGDGADHNGGGYVNSIGIGLAGNTDL